MDERREPPPEDGSRRQIAAGPGGLTGTQKARSRYARHVAECRACSDIDRDRCAQGNQLWRDWEAACDAAFQQLGSEIRHA